MNYRNYRIEYIGVRPGFLIKPTGSGQLPVPLRGDFTSLARAKRAVDFFIASLAPKRRKQHEEKEGSSVTNQ